MAPFRPADLKRMCCFAIFWCGVVSSDCLSLSLSISNMVTSSLQADFDDLMMPDPESLRTRVVINSTLVIDPIKRHLETMLATKLFQLVITEVHEVLDQSRTLTLTHTAFDVLICAFADFAGPFRGRVDGNGTGERFC